MRSDIVRVLFLNGMKHISMQLKKTLSDTRETERGELMKYFVDRLNPSRVNDGLPPLSMGRMGKLLQAIPTKDLYYLQRICNDANNFSKKFWWEINPKNHTPEAKAETAARWKKNS